MKSIYQYSMFMIISASCITVSVADELSSDSANTMTCGTNFISVGDSEDAVMNQCGEPSFKEDVAGPTVAYRVRLSIN